jgi:hypothetical protein
MNGNSQFKIEYPFMYNEVYLKAKQFAVGQTKSINHSTVRMILSSSGYLRIPVYVTEAV